MTIYGYARVSTDGHSLASQDAQLQGAGCAKVYADKVSGARTDRPKGLIFEKRQSLQLLLAPGTPGHRPGAGAWRLGDGAGPALRCQHRLPLSPPQGASAGAAARQADRPRAPARERVAVPARQSGGPPRSQKEKLRAAYLGALDAVDQIEAHRAEAMASGKLTPAGMTENGQEVVRVAGWDWTKGAATKPGSWFLPTAEELESGKYFDSRDEYNAMPSGSNRRSQMRHRRRDAS
jgi:Resolvase, N terminal domain